MTSKTWKTYHQWLTELTALPTAAGRESRVIEWIQAWAKRRRYVKITSDRYGNLTLQRDSAGSRRRKGTAKPPIFITAHMDHPAFVVHKQIDERHVTADFRGGVHDDYFIDSKVQLHSSSSSSSDGKTKLGTIIALEQPAKSTDKRATIRFNSNVEAARGDVVTWKIPHSRIRGDRLRAPVCDDLAALAAALAAFDALNKRRSPRGKTPDVRLLFTRCEEVGFIGAIGACKNKSLPRDAVVITLENSKSFAESPIGGGPIIRVGDRISTFNHAINFRIHQIATKLATQDDSFKFQRKLMPGGACEATAFQDFGFAATCLCLPLGNYHNMNESTGRIDAETISVRDFDNLIQLLVATGIEYHQDNAKTPRLRHRLDKLFESRRHLIEGKSK